MGSDAPCTNADISPDQPTRYPDLNAVLNHLIEGARRALRENFIGAYLHGSIAVGDFSELSDCDFMIVTLRDLSADELAALQRLHAAIHNLPYPCWRSRLEGSYAPVDVLRRASAEPCDPPGEPRPADWADPGMSGAPPRVYPFWYLVHGAATLVRSEHDNSLVVRWALREKGVTMAGPDPRALIDPVPPSALRADVRETLLRIRTLGMQPIHIVAWQAFWVGLFCRILHTLETGEVTSKKAAMNWAWDALDPAWRDLIARAQTLRRDDAAQSAQPADPAEVVATRAFAEYAASWASRHYSSVRSSCHLSQRRD